jgi:alkanesulfonate monooxygenase SsuD/methylene tetrahydromethanopterin reductase-like flavin-dependent oxidoreductase (luciferase family)
MKLIARHADGTVSTWESNFPVEKYRDAMKEVVETVVQETKDAPTVVLARIK